MMYTKPRSRFDKAIGSLLGLSVALCIGTWTPLLPGQTTETPAPSFSTTDISFFREEVLPVLKTYCFKCHGEQAEIKGELRLTSRAGVLRGGESGAAIDLETHSESLLLSAIRYEAYEMPPTGKLPDEHIRTLTRWVEKGLPWDGDRDYGFDPSRVADLGEGKDYWAYQPVQRPELPQVENRSWAKQSPDYFLLSKLEQRDLQPNSKADRVTLIRRAYYDLIGLPPTREEVERFVKDTSPDAWTRVIDHLLDSPHYGEKWGRHWLDLVRYAETHGYERDSPKPEAWRYRDYVIRSFNQDKPYDQFIIEQLAGDELSQVTSESLTATGYYRLGLWDDEPADRLLAFYDGLDDVVKTTSEVMLGMTMGCVRCHSHRGDPIDHSEYYRFLAYFRDVTPMTRDNLRRWATPEQEAEHARQLAEKESREGELYSAMYQIEQQFQQELVKQGAAVPVSSDLTDLRFRFYRDTWTELPDFDSLKFETEGQIANQYISLQPASRQQAFGMVFTAQLKVPRAGTYQFQIESSEGVRLHIGDRQVAIRDAQGIGQCVGEVELKPGLIPLRLEYFNGNTQPKLTVHWSGPGVHKRALTDDGRVQNGAVLVGTAKQGEGHKWLYTTQLPHKNWNRETFDDASWLSGQSGFGSEGTPGAVVRTPWSSTDIWLRTQFQLDQLPDVLSLDIHHDEDVQVYLNGKLIYEAQGYLKDYHRVGLARKEAKALKIGENTLAVHCQQTGGGQYVDVGLVAAEAAVDLAQELRRRGAELLGEQTYQAYLAHKKELDESRKRKLPPPGTPIMSVAERGRAKTHVLLRGNPHAPDQEVTAGVPEVLSSPQPAFTPASESQPTSGKRLALAKWIASSENPLTARVLVNRLWQYHFGRAIVPTANDFGKLGEPPTHPELLDWLAAEFMEGGWRIKRMHRLLMTSAAYQMSAQASAAGMREDPSNLLFWRYPMRRLGSEEVRDTMLAITGELNLKQFGPSIYVPIAEEVLKGQSRPGAGWGKSSPQDQTRRSVYIHLKRSLLVPILEMHDQADTDTSCPVRYVTTVPTQALGMLNGDFSNRQAARFAERLQRDHPHDLEQQVRQAIELVTLREPTREEISRDLSFIRQLTTEEKLAPDQALRVYALMMLNTNEFIYLD